MKIYFAHPRNNFDYEKELYKPLRASILNSAHQFIFPHEKEANGSNSKGAIRSCDVFCAEVSQPATGVGIEIGWADMFDVPVLGFYKKGTKPSSSLNYIAREVIEYSDSNELVEKLSDSLAKI